MPPLPLENPKATSALSEEDRQELQNVKELCLSVLKSQKRLTREVKRVRESVDQNPFSGIEDPPAALSPSSVAPEERQVTHQDIEELEKKQTKDLRTHLIALDMKEQGKIACCLPFASQIPRLE